MSEEKRAFQNSSIVFKFLAGPEGPEANTGSTSLRRSAEKIKKSKKCFYYKKINTATYYESLIFVKLINY